MHLPTVCTAAPGAVSGARRERRRGPYSRLTSIGIVKLSELYGPDKRKGFATAPTNQAFDQNLRDRNPTWGLRDLEVVAAIAQSLGFSVPTVPEMPANNLSVVFRRT
jgi:hypothetical protein